MKNKITLTLDSEAECIRAADLVGDVQYSLRFQTVYSSTPGLLNEFLICYPLNKDLDVKINEQEFANITKICVKDVFFLLFVSLRQYKMCGFVSYILLIPFLPYLKVYADMIELAEVNFNVAYFWIHAHARSQKQSWATGETRGQKVKQSRGKTSSSFGLWLLD